MAYKVPITIMADVETLSKKERIKFAKTSSDQKLLEVLAHDKSPEVRSTLFSNKNLFFETLVYNVLSKDKNKNVREALKKYCEEYTIDRECWVVYYCSLKLFGKIPEYNKEERRAIQSFVYFISASPKLIIDFSFGENGFYTPYSPRLEYYIRCLHTMSKVIPNELNEKIKKHYMSSNKSATEEIDDAFVFFDQMYNHVPFEFVSWIAALGKVHFYMTIIYPFNSNDVEHSKSLIINRIPDDKELHSLAFDALVKNKYHSRY